MIIFACPALEPSSKGWRTSLGAEAVDTRSLLSASCGAWAWASDLGLAALIWDGFRDASKSREEERRGSSPIPSEVVAAMSAGMSGVQGRKLESAFSGFSWGRFRVQPLLFLRGFFAFLRIL